MATGALSGRVAAAAGGGAGVGAACALAAAREGGATLFHAAEQQAGAAAAPTVTRSGAAGRPGPHHGNRARAARPSRQRDRAGMIPTPRDDAAATDPEQRAAHLASPAGACITGTTLVIDGGVSLLLGQGA